MRIVLLVLASLFAVDSALALQPWAKTAAEDAMCKASIAGRDTSDGRNWMHMHHYCDGLRFYNRALSSTQNPSDFKFNIQESIGGFDYVLRNTSPDFFMRPEVTAGKARALALAGRKAEAVSLYTSVIHQTPNFVPAYLYLADHYSASDPKKALDLVSEGLRHNPETKNLQRRYRELGGKLPYPEPLAKVESNEPVTEVEVQPPALIEQNQEPTKGPEAQTDTATEKPKIGSPDNPYCRFCPD